MKVSKLNCAGNFPLLFQSQRLVVSNVESAPGLSVIKLICSIWVDVADTELTFCWVLTGLQALQFRRDSSTKCFFLPFSLSTSLLAAKALLG